MQDYLDQHRNDADFMQAYEETLEDLRVAVALARMREQRKLTQIALAERSNMTQAQIARIENGQIPELPTLRKLLVALDAELTMRPDGSVDIKPVRGEATAA